jgi:hypothetical protein
MKEKDIEALVKKFERVMGPVASAIAKDVAKKKKVLRKERISPKSDKEYRAFMQELRKEYSKIFGEKLTETIIGM